MTAGKIAVDSPEFLYKNSLSYARKGLDAHIDTDYMSKRYFTYTDDNSCFRPQPMPGQPRLAGIFLSPGR